MKKYLTKYKSEVITTNNSEALMKPGASEQKFWHLYFKSLLVYPFYCIFLILEFISAYKKKDFMCGDHKISRYTFVSLKAFRRTIKRLGLIKNYDQNDESNPFVLGFVDTKKDVA